MKLQPVGLLCILLLSIATARGQTEAKSPAAEIELWPEGKMPGKGAKDSEADVPSKGDNVRRITNISRPTLTPLLVKRDSPTPAAIICPGGGYGYVVYDKEGTEVAAWLNAAGIHAFVLKYRTPNNRDGAMHDVQRALSTVRARATEWNVDPQRLGVVGFSAGGHLAAKASAPREERSYEPIDAVDRQSSRPDFVVLVYPAYLDDKQGKVSPDLNLQAGIPPTLIVHNEDDKNHIAGSKLYHAALEAAKVKHEFKNYASGGHGYGMRCTKEARAWPDDALAWLRGEGVK